MIGLLQGYISHSGLNYIILNVNNVGYKIFCSSKILHNIQNLINKKISLFIETTIKDEQTILIGFLTDLERQIFCKLITIQGIGSKIAIAALSSLTPSQIIAAINTQDAKTFTLIDGIGPKAAARIIMELKGKNLLESNLITYDVSNMEQHTAQNIKSDNQHFEKSNNIHTTDSIKKDSKVLNLHKPNLTSENKQNETLTTHQKTNLQPANKTTAKTTHKKTRETQPSLDEIFPHFIDITKNEYNEEKKILEQNKILFDCISALTNLGYARYDANNATAQILNNNNEITFEELFKLSIQQLSTK